MVKIGVVSDVHCHVAALETALEMMAHEVDDVFVAGDVIYEYRFSNDVVNSIRDRAFPCVLGNHEMVFLGPRGDQARNAPGVDQVALEWLSRWPVRRHEEVGGRLVTMVHGSPWPPYDRYLTESDPSWAGCADIEADVLITGHTHVPMVKLVAGTLVVNPGSLGESREIGARDMASYAIVDLERMDAEIVRFPLPQRVPTPLA
jgi:putative phosphoesterase